MDFADRLKELRKARGYSQQDLAKKVGMSKSSISMYEVGERAPSIEVLELFGDFFNVSTDYLLGKEDGSVYYLDPEAAEIANEIYNNKELRILFDTTRNVSKEDLQFIVRMVEGLKKDEGD